MTVGDMLARMDASELTHWRALYLLEDDESNRRRLDGKAVAAVKAARASKSGAAQPRK